MLNIDCISHIMRYSDIKTSKNLLTSSQYVFKTTILSYLSNKTFIISDRFRYTFYVNYLRAIKYLIIKINHRINSKSLFKNLTELEYLGIKIYTKKMTLRIPKYFSINKLEIETIRNNKNYIILPSQCKVNTLKLYNILIPKCKIYSSIKKLYVYCRSNKYYTLTIISSIIKLVINGTIRFNSSLNNSNLELLDINCCNGNPFVNMDVKFPPSLKSVQICLEKPNKFNNNIFENSFIENIYIDLDDITKLDLILPRTTKYLGISLIVDYWHNESVVMSFATKYINIKYPNIMCEFYGLSCYEFGWAYLFE